MNERKINQKQLKALTKCMWPDESRPGLAGLAFKDKAIVATDGYVLVALNIESEWKDEYEGDEKGDYIVPIQKIKEWCKTHTSKAEITIPELWDMARKEYQFPEWRRLLSLEPSTKPKDGEMPQPKFKMADFSTAINVFLGDEMTMSVTGEHSALKLVNSKGDMAFIMPLS